MLALRFSMRALEGETGPGFLGIVLGLDLEIASLGLGSDVELVGTESSGR